MKRDPLDQLETKMIPDDTKNVATPACGSSRAAVGDVRAYEPFPVNALPEPMRGYVVGSCAAIGCDAAYVALPLLSTLASAIGNSRSVLLKKDWSEPAIIWTATIGESGSLKSPAQDAAARFPRQRQTEAYRAHQSALRHFQVESHPNGESGPANPATKPKPPVLMRSLVDDTTIEALGPILVENPRGVLILRDELASWLGAFDRYGKSSRGGGEAAKWIELHGGRPIIVDRRHGEPRTLVVPRAAVSISGGIQPGILRRIMTQELRQNGLLARLLLAWPPRRPRRWTETEIDNKVALSMQKVYDRLWELKPAISRDGEPSPVPIPLAAEAKKIFAAFVNAHGDEQTHFNDELAAAWAKLEGYAARLALVHHLVRWAADESADTQHDIGRESIHAGIQLARWFGQEARRVYARLREDAEDGRDSEAVEWIRQRGGCVTARELRRGCGQYASTEAAEEQLNRLARAGLGHWDDMHSTARGGQPTRRFFLREPSTEPA